MNVLLTLLSTLLLGECLLSQRLWLESFQRLGEYEHRVFGDQMKLRAEHCQRAPDALSVSLYWRHKGEWRDICTMMDSPITERYWKISARPKHYLRLLRGELPPMESIILR